MQVYINGAINSTALGVSSINQTVTVTSTGSTRVTVQAKDKGGVTFKSTINVTVQ